MAMLQRFLQLHILNTVVIFSFKMSNFKSVRLLNSKVKSESLFFRHLNTADVINCMAETALLKLSGV